MARITRATPTAWSRNNFVHLATGQLGAGPDQQSDLLQPGRRRLLWRSAHSCRLQRTRPPSPPSPASAPFAQCPDVALHQQRLHQLGDCFWCGRFDLQRGRHRRPLRADGATTGRCSPTTSSRSPTRLKLTLGAPLHARAKKLDVELQRQQHDVRILRGVHRRPRRPLPCVIPCAPGRQLSRATARREASCPERWSLSWKPIDSILLYGSYSRGYKAGGFNLDRVGAAARQNGNGAIRQSTAVPAALQLRSGDQHRLRTWPEVRRARIDVNIAVFRQDFNDFQLNTFNGINFEVENINSCSALNVTNGDTDNSATTGACAGKIQVRRPLARRRARSLHPAVPQRPVQPGHDLCEHTYRNDLVGANGEPLSPALFQLSGPQHVQRLGAGDDRLVQLDPADRIERHARLALHRWAPRQRLQHRLRSRHRKEPEGLCAWSMAASA